MKKIIPILLLTFFVSTPVCASKKSTKPEWSGQDFILMGTYNLVHVIDWGQTRYGINHPNEYSEETNIILGKSPKIQDVDLYFTTTLLLQNTIIYLLPSRYRKLYLPFFIGFESMTVMRNLSLIGVKIQF